MKLSLLRLLPLIGRCWIGRRAIERTCVRRFAAIATRGQQHALLRLNACLALRRVMAAHRLRWRFSLGLVERRRVLRYTRAALPWLAGHCAVAGALHAFERRPEILLDLHDVTA